MSHPGWPAHAHGEQRDLFDGRAERDAGIDRVLGNVSPLWREAYADAVGQWFDALPVGAEFTGDDLRRAIEPLIGPAHHFNAWGGQANGVLRDWLTDERVARCGFRQGARPETHAHNYPLYRKIAR